MSMHYLPERSCPNCGHALSWTTNLQDDEQPEPDDLTICLFCESVLVFDQAMALQRLTQAAYEDLDEDSQLAVTLMKQQVAHLRHQAAAAKRMH